MVVERSIDLNSQVLGVIRKEILEGQLPPGMRLHVGQLAERLDVSPTPVKSALGRLASEGLVEFGSRGGAFVSQLAATDVDEIIEIREMIEVFAARRAVESGVDADWDQLEALAESLRRRISADGAIDFAGFSADDIAFHRHLIGLAGNQRLTALYESQHVYTVVARAHYRLLVEPGERQPPEGGTMHVYHEHLEIVRALRARDLERVEAAIRNHLEIVRRFAHSATNAAKEDRTSQRIEHASLLNG